MASHKGIDDHRPLGLRDTVFHAIQGFPDVIIWLFLMVNI